MLGANPHHGSVFSLFPNLHVSFTYVSDRQLHREEGSRRPVRDWV